MSLSNSAHPLACVDLAISLAKSVLKERLVAVYTIGSLAHGGFSPSVSDVDLAFILDETISPADEQNIHGINAVLKDSKFPLSERVSIFWSSWNQLQKGEIRVGRFPAVDRLDFIEHRKIIWGLNQNGDLKVPTQKDLIIDGAEFSLAKLLIGPHDAWISDAQKLLQRGQRQVTKTVLFPVRFIYTGVTGKIGTNEAAVAYWTQNYPDNSVKELVRASLRWRTNYSEAEAMKLLPQNLPCVYSEFIRKYVTYCRDYEFEDLAKALERYRQT